MGDLKHFFSSNCTSRGDGSKWFVLDDLEVSGVDHTDHILHIFVYDNISGIANKDVCFFCFLAPSPIHKQGIPLEGVLS